MILPVDVTGLQATVPTDVKQDGQETRVINVFFTIISINLEVKVSLLMFIHTRIQNFFPRGSELKFIIKKAKPTCGEYDHDSRG